MGSEMCIRDRYIPFVLFKIMLIALNLKFSQRLIFPSIVGVDPWWHQMFTLKILDAGHIPEGYAYSQLPLMHLLIGSTSLITRLNYKIATMLSISLLQVLCDLLFTFLLGSFLFNNKVGLLGGLLLGIANWHVMDFWTIPNTMAAVFILIIIYLLLKVEGKKPHIGISLAIFLMKALILTHTVAAVWMAILLFVFWSGFEVYNWIHGNQKMPVTFILSILFIVGMLSWWTYASGHIKILAELVKCGFSLDYFLRPVPKEVIQYAYNVPFSEQLFNNLGTILFFIISLIGCLHMVSRRFGNFYSFTLAISGTITLAITFFAPITGRGILENRWCYYSQILLALPAAVSLFLFCLVIKNKLGKSLFLSASMFLLSFLMILSPIANLDNPAFSPNTQVRYAFKESELQAVKTISKIWSKKVGVDSYYSVIRHSSYLMEDISVQIYNRNYSDCQDMFILIREEVVNHPFMLIHLTYKLDYDPREVLTSQGFSKVYDCCSVSGFVYSANYCERD